MHIESLVIEVTRRCNLNCDHCLRGCAQNMDMDLKHVDTLFSKIGSIGSLTLTGGEPSLVPDKILGIIKLAKMHSIDIADFYIATNGATNEKFPEFVHTCLSCWAYCSCKEISCVHWSNDVFHNADGNNIELLGALSFAGPKYVEDKRFQPDYTGRTLLSQGNAEGWGMNCLETKAIEIDEEYGRICENEVYLNCKRMLGGRVRLVL